MTLRPNESVSGVIKILKDSVSNVTRAIVMVSTVPYRHNVLSLNIVIYDINKSILKMANCYKVLLCDFIKYVTRQDYGLRFRTLGKRK